MLTDEQFLRYQRQISLPEIGEAGQLSLINSHVLMIGCGGLGCSVALYLAGSGVGKIVISDDDKVEESNLARQVAYRQLQLGESKTDALAQQIKQLNPSVSVRKLAKRLDVSQLKLEASIADIVIDCTDNFKSRQLVNKACFDTKTPLVSAAAIGWQGQLAVFDYAKDGGCYRCLYPFDKSNQAQKCIDSGIVGPVVGTMGNLQALAAIQKLATGNFKLKSHVLHLFDGLSFSWKQFDIPKDVSCSVCKSENVS